MVLDSKFRIEVPERVVVELFSVIRDKHSWYPIPADDVLPNKTSNILFYDSGYGFGFHPFCEVVDADHQELQLPNCCKEGAHDI